MAAGKYAHCGWFPKALPRSIPPGVLDSSGLFIPYMASAPPPTQTVTEGDSLRAYFPIDYLENSPSVPKVPQ